MSVWQRGRRGAKPLIQSADGKSSQKGTGDRFYRPPHGGGGGTNKHTRKKKEQPPAQCDSALRVSSAGKTITLSVWIREPGGGGGNVNNSFLCRGGAKAARRLMAGGIESSVGGLPFVRRFLHSRPLLFPPAAQTTHKSGGAGVGGKKSVSPSHTGGWSCHVVCDLSLLHLFRSAAANPTTLHFPTTGKRSHGPCPPSLHYGRVEKK